jgi:RimJ/RimL family protein N-acetyltransferase
MKQIKLNLEGGKVSLRMLRLSDAWDVYTNIRDKEVGKWTGPDVCARIENTFIRFASQLLRHLRKGIQLFCQALYPPKNPKVFRLGIVLRETRRVIGIITLSRSKSQPQCAEIGFWIGKKYWGHGLATEAVQLVLEFGFSNIGLERIEAWTFEKNVGSIKVMEKCGFKLDGVVNAAYLKYNEMQNRLNYRILKSEYKNISGL